MSRSVRPPRLTSQNRLAQASRLVQEATLEDSCLEQVRILRLDTWPLDQVGHALSTSVALSAQENSNLVNQLMKYIKRKETFEYFSMKEDINKQRNKNREENKEASVQGKSVSRALANPFLFHYLPFHFTFYSCKSLMTMRD